jgi:hypothetical protein
MAQSAFLVDEHFEQRASDLCLRRCTGLSFNLSFVPGVTQAPLSAHSPFAVAARECLTRKHDYVEGFVFPGGRPQPLPHAWTVDPSGKHTDTTRVGPADLYFAVHRVDAEQFASMMEEQEFFDRFFSRDILPLLQVQKDNLKQLGGTAGEH